MASPEPAPKGRAAYPRPLLAAVHPVGAPRGLSPVDREAWCGVVICKGDGDHHRYTSNPFPDTYSPCGRRTHRVRRREPIPNGIPCARPEGAGRVPAARGFATPHGIGLR